MTMKYSTARSAETNVGKDFNLQLLNVHQHKQLLLNSFYHQYVMSVKNTLRRIGTDSYMKT